MTIVVWGGLGRTPANQVGPVEFGLTRKLGGVIPGIPGLLALGLEEWYVVDYRIRRRRPATKQEWAQLRQYLQIRDRANQRMRDSRASDRQLALELGRAGLTIDTYQVRTFAPRDYSGLVPISNVVGNPTARVNSFGTHAQGAKRPDPKGIRTSVRTKSPGGLRTGTFDQALLSRPAALGRNRRDPGQRLSSRRA